MENFTNFKREHPTPRSGNDPPRRTGRGNNSPDSVFDGKAAHS
ncbi:MAG: hypothetical protein PHP74_03070 [Candidatus Gracilibacteria bacterium]|nr:hypothetical protein [Candidatus Gracilibacteria bacterium]